MSNERGAVRIGTYHLREQTDFRVPQEYAGASHVIRVRPGHYPVEIRTYVLNGQHRTYIGVSLAGTCIHRSWDGKLDSTHGKGEPDIHTLTPRLYELADMVLSGDVTLHDGYHVRASGYDGEVYDSVKGEYVKGRVVVHAVHSPGGGPVLIS